VLEPNLDVLVVMGVDGAVSLLHGSEPLPEGLLVRFVAPVFIGILDSEVSLVHRVQDQSLLTLGALMVSFESEAWEFVIPGACLQAFTFSCACVECNFL